ncbi:MAG: amino acid adenylation domain-containing protein [Bacteroidota bacterium]
MVTFKHLGEALSALALVQDRGVQFIKGKEVAAFLSYADLYDRAQELLTGLRELGVAAGEELVIQLEDNQQLLEVFWACLLGGIIPVPLELALREETRLKVLKVWPYLERPRLISTQLNIEQSGWAKEAYGDYILDQVILLETIKPEKKKAVGYAPSPDDIAFIQFSSGSTGDPKGVVLSHRNLLCNIEAIVDAVDGFGKEERTLSWMPLTHDMGMIGMHLVPLVMGWQHYIMPSALFVRSPNLWLSKIAEHRITLTASPNFGYRFAMRYFDQEKMAQLDLSSLKGIINGAEPVSIEVCRAFAQQMEAYGLRPEAITPVYGLAEASLAVSFTPLDAVPEAMYLHRKSLNTGEQVLITTEGPESVAFVKVGTTVKHVEVRIVDEAEEELAEEYVGYILIKGDNVCQGYYNHPQATIKTIDEEGWLNTGDLGCIIDGALYITGRAKEIIFVNGQNYYPHDLERLAEAVDGVGLGKIVITAYTDAKLEREKVLAFLLYKSKNQERFLAIADRCRRQLSQEAGIEIDEVIPIRKVPKTTSGKVQRFQLCRDYQEGHFDEVLETLAQLRQQKRSSTPTASQDITIQQLQAIWQKVFDLPVGPADTFQSLGGNSLKAGQIIGLIQEQFGVELPVRLFFEPLSLPMLSQFLQEATASNPLPLSPVPPQATYPLSSVQRRLFYQWQLDKTALNYNLPLLLSIKGPLNSDRLQTAYGQLIHDHEALRTAFDWQAGEAVQQIKDQVALPFEVLKVEAKEAQAIIAQQLQPFDLTTAPLCRARLLQVEEDQHWLFLDFHHIIMDGISVSIFLKELFERYKGKEIAPPTVHYKSYIQWEQQWRQQDQYRHQANYWKSNLKGALPILQLNTDKVRPSLWQSKGARLPFQLPSTHSQQLKALAEEEQVSPALIFLVLYKVLLGYYSSEDNLIVGIPVAGRSHPAFAHSLGMFVNNLAIKSSVAKGESFRSYLRQLRKHYIEALDHQHYLFEDLVNTLEVQRSPDRQLLFDTMFLFQNMEFPDWSTTGLAIQRAFFDPGTAKYDLTMEVFPTADTYYFELEYATALFEQSTVQKMGEHFLLLTAAILRQSDQELAKLDWLSIEEKQRFRPSSTPAIAEPATLPRRFETIARSFANQTALIADQQTLSYKALDEKANALAIQLLGKGLRSEDRVAVAINNSIDLIISLLAILKAGGAFVPIDTQLPAGRKQFLLEDSAARFLLSNSESLEADPDFFAIVTEEQLLLIDHHQLRATALQVQREVKPSQLAYMIYTSGTTGRPKGVIIEHRNMVNYLDWAVQEYIRPGALASPLFTSMAFDLTLTAVFVPLLSGNTVMIKGEGTVDEHLQEIFENGATGLVKLTPSHLRVLDQLTLKLPRLRRPLCLVVGGEALDRQLAQRTLAQLGEQVELYNEYGPTETTVGCTVHRFDPAQDQRDFVPIGRPIANTQVYVLNEALQLVPQGVSGELYVAGAGVGRGYWNRATLTAERFIPSPFDSNERLYRTGDRVRWLNDWTLDFQGRKDQQVKIRGYRIELEEISQQLSAHPEIGAAVVLAQQERLLTYYVAPVHLEALTVEAWLRQQLPSYMIPQQWVRLEQLPLTLNGKIDKVALLKLTPKSNAEQRLPQTEMEEQIAKVFREILQQEEIGVREDFFALGGDSIKAVQMATALRGAGLAVKTCDVLQYRTIEQISYEASRLSAAAARAQEPLQGKRALHPIEQWFFDQEFEHPEHYNQSVLLAFKVAPQPERLQTVFEQLVNHFDGLRTNVDLQNREVFYNPKHINQPFVLEQFDLRQDDLTQELDQLRVIGEQLKSQFDLEKDLLLKAALFRCSDQTTRLLITAHHLIIDGISWRILLADFYRLYQNFTATTTASFPAKTAAMRDWVEVLTAQHAKLEEARTYWSAKRLDGFALPFDQFTSQFYEKNKANFSGSIDANTTRAIQQNSQTYYKTDLQTILCLATGLSLKDWTGQSRLIIELETHGRHLEEVDVSGTIGWFTALHPLYLELKDANLSELLVDVKEQIRAVPFYGMAYPLYFQVYPPTVRVNYLGEFMQEVDNDLFQYQALNTGRDISAENHMTAPISLNAMIINEALQIDMEYSTELFSPSSMEQFQARLFDYLAQISTQLQEQHTIHLSPSDFDAIELDAGDLETLFS